MRRLPVLAAAVFSLLTAVPPNVAQAQDAGAELMRKAKAAEKENGFCASAGIERIPFAQIQAKLNQTLSQSDAAVRVTWLVAQDGGQTMCFHFTFAPPAQRDGKKCRATETYGCLVGGECNTAPGDFICEKSPGEWD